MKKLLVLFVLLIGCFDVETDSSDEEDTIVPPQKEFPNISPYNDNLDKGMGCLAYKTVYFKGIPVPTECTIMPIDKGRPPEQLPLITIEDKVVIIANEI